MSRRRTKRPASPASKHLPTQVARASAQVQESPDAATLRATQDAAQRVRLTQLGDALSKVDVMRAKDLPSILARYGVKPADWPAPKPPEAVQDIAAWATERADKSSVVELQEAISGRGEARKLDEATQRAAHDMRIIAPTAIDLDPTVEVGTPGTPLYGGVLAVDPSYRLTPFVARGHASSLGVYEEHLRDPLVYQCFQTIRQLLVSGSWSMSVPELAQEWMQPAQLAQLEREVDGIWSALLNIEDGWEHFVEHAATCVIFGFSIFEVVWRDTPRGPVPRRLAFREASTVDQWLMTQRQDRLLAVRFVTGAPGYSYVLPAWGERLTDRRILLNTLGGRGNNFEGVPPTRPIDFLITYKKLLLTIVAAAAERFGSPILTSRVDAALLSLPGFDPEQSAWDRLALILESLRALETPTLALPPGLLAEYLGPPGSMPDLMAQVAYCDQQITTAFSNQGSLLGQNAHGSYALAETQDNQLLRSAPYYAQVIMRSLNALVRDMLIARGWRLPQYPQIRWQIGGAADASRLIGDMATVIEAARSWPRAAQQLVLKLLGLPPDTYEAADAYEVAPDQPTQNVQLHECADSHSTGLAESWTPPQGVQGNARRALEVREGKPESERGMTSTGLARARDLSNGRAVSEDTLRRMVAYFERHEVDKQGETWDAQGKGWQAWMGWGGDEGWRWAKRIVDGLDRDARENIELAEMASARLVSLAEEDWPASAALMDRAEADLASRFATIQRAQQARWRELIRDNEGPQDLVSDRDQIREEFRPRYIGAVREVMASIGQDAARELAQRMGLDYAATDYALPDELEMLAANVGDEMTSRVIGVQTSAEVERVRGSARQAVPIIGASTVALIASRAISGAYNAGRADLVRRVMDRLTSAGERVRIMASRSAVMDPATCTVCARLDGATALVGSKRFRDLSPPNRCDGGERCRCVWIYRVEPSALDAIRSLGGLT